MKKVLSLFLLFLTACPALQTRNDIKTKDGRFQSSTNAVNTSSAEKVAKEQELLEEIRNLYGKIEELSFKVNQLEANANTTPLENRIENLERKLLSYGESLILLEQKIGGAPSSGLRTSPSSAKPKGPYDRAEALFAKSDWKNAILEYNKYRDNFPKGKSYADATYKIGVCFQELGLVKEAQSFYQEVIEKFPKSKTAKSAKYRLNQLKK